jgi:D-alanine-D-alanine ligase
MLPSSFFFHQAAEIGLDAKDFLTYILRTSLIERIKAGKNAFLFTKLLEKLDKTIAHKKQKGKEKMSIAVIMGGYSSERHISMESGRNIYEKLASSTKYQAIPIFLTGTENEQELYILPINYMLKDNADDIKDKINSKEKKQHLIIEKIKENAKIITEKYTENTLKTPQKISFQELKKLANFAFIALHGRPGEDGALQTQLKKYEIAFNGSDVESSQITINKYETNEILAKNGILTAKHCLVFENEWQENKEKIIEKIEKEFQYPLITKPADDGCSSAVKKIKNTEQLQAFAEMMFRKNPEFLEKEQEILALKNNEEFPQKSYFLLEELIKSNEAEHFLEITGGMLTTLNPKGEIVYEVFEPSEALATGDVLSLEEKFLAGEGQNITPALYSKNNKEDNKKISQKVKEVLQKTAEILNVQGYCRIDAFVRIFENNEVEVIIIEINSLPGMTPATCIFHQAAINQYTPFGFIDKIIDFGFKIANTRK